MSSTFPCRESELSVQYLEKVLTRVRPDATKIREHKVGALDPTSAMARTSEVN